MGWIITLIVGGFVGWIASIIMKTNAQMGWLANVIIGVLGSFVGVWLVGLVGIDASGAFMHFVVALAGAVLLIFILRAFGMFGRGARSATSR